MEEKNNMPKMKVWEEKEEVIVQVYISGIDEKDISLEVKKESELRKRLLNEYESKLKSQVAEKEKKLKEKNAALEKDIKEKIKSFYG